MQRKPIDQNFFRKKPILRWFLLLALLAGLFYPAAGGWLAPVQASTAQPEVTAFDLLVAMNTMRVSNGLPALIEDPIINAVAQSTAETMAANNLSTHIGNVSGRVQAAGYGGGAKVWATENIAIGHMTIDVILSVWSDAAHMLAATIPAYCNMGAGVAKGANGYSYYVFQAAYTTAKACGEYKSVGGIQTNPAGSTTIGGRAGGISQLIVPVQVATPDADGKIYHVVQAGQSFWSIAAAYKIVISDIEKWNNLDRDVPLRPGQKLFIPGPNTQGFATPTPVGMVLTATPDVDGMIIHTVQTYQTLSAIAQAYGVDVDRLLFLNAWQVDWPLQIGQKLLVRPKQITPSPTNTPSPTPRPLTAIEKLTPAADGKYYHTVHSGENLAWIADLYKIALKDLLAWNQLKGSEVLRVNQKLLLQVTPPATATYTPAPATVTRTPAPVTPTRTATPTASSTPTLAVSATGEATPAGPGDEPPPSAWLWIGLVAAGILGATLLYNLVTKKPSAP